MKRGLARCMAALEHQNQPWVVGFSGGKDSSAVLVLLQLALRAFGSPTHPIHVVYCDTGVEIPAARRLATSMLEFFEARGAVSCHAATPRVTDRFFVKVIGRGYPPPTNKFRWCTDKIRVRPIENLISTLEVDRYQLILGARYGESSKRDQTLRALASEREGFFQSSNPGASGNFLPVFDYSTTEIWETIIQHEELLGVSASKLLGLYREASGECPIVRDPRSPPCGSARFGCWTCTVVTQDRTARSLIESGHSELIPLNSFRDWLAVIRQDRGRRWPVRRNGREGLGPFTIAAREEILDRLLSAEHQCGFELIGHDERQLIRAMWEADRSLEDSILSAA